MQVYCIYHVHLSWYIIGLCIIDGGGGFSNYWGTQNYQKTQVDTYLKDNSNKLPPNNVYNSSGRYLTTPITLYEPIYY